VRDHEAEGVVMRDLDRTARTLTVQEAVLAQLWSLGGHAYVVTDQDEVPQDDPDDPMRTAWRSWGPRGMARRWVYYRLQEHAEAGRAVQVRRGYSRAARPADGRPAAPPRW
jgi:hypothetical protein